IISHERRVSTRKQNITHAHKEETHNHYLTIFLCMLIVCAITILYCYLIMQICDSVSLVLLLIVLHSIDFLSHYFVIVLQVFSLAHNISLHKVQFSLQNSIVLTQAFILFTIIFFLYTTKHQYTHRHKEETHNNI
ncbi:hypothetical protein ACJX0J_041195, partial [Zea mays]